MQRDNNLGKPVSAFVKNRLLRQSTDGRVPLSITWLSMGFLDTRSDAGLDYSLTLERRFSSVHQLILARKFWDKFSLQVAPTLVHRNLVPTSEDDGIALGVGFSGQYSLPPKLALSAEVSPMFTGVNRHVDPEFGIGIDIETEDTSFSYACPTPRGSPKTACIRGHGLLPRWASTYLAPTRFDCSSSCACKCPSRHQSPFCIDMNAQE